MFLVIFFICAVHVNALEVDKNNFETQLVEEIVKEMENAKVEVDTSKAIEGSIEALDIVENEEMDLDDLLKNIAEEEKALSLTDKIKRKLEIYWENRDIVKNMVKEHIVENKKKYIAAVAAAVVAVVFYRKRDAIKAHVGKYKKEYLRIFFKKYIYN